MAKHPYRGGQPQYIQLRPAFTLPTQQVRRRRRGVLGAFFGGAFKTAAIFFIPVVGIFLGWELFDRGWEHLWEMALQHGVYPAAALGALALIGGIVGAARR